MTVVSTAAPAVFPKAPMIRYGYPPLFTRIKPHIQPGLFLLSGYATGGVIGPEYTSPDGMKYANFYQISGPTSGSYTLFVRGIGNASTAGRKLVRYRVFKNMPYCFNDSSTLFALNGSVSGNLAAHYVAGGTGLRPRGLKQSISTIDEKVWPTPWPVGDSHSIYGAEGSYDIEFLSKPAVVGEAIQIYIYPESDNGTYTTKALYGEIEIWDGDDLLFGPEYPNATTWTRPGGTGTITPMNFADGTAGALLDDTDAANATVWYSNAVFHNLPGRFEKVRLSIRVRKGTATGTTFLIDNNSQGQQLLHVDITWNSDGTIASINGPMIGKILDIIDMLDGSYEFQMETEYEVNDADPYRIYVYAATGASPTGSSYVGGIRIFGNSKPTTLKFLNSQSIWTPGKSSVGGRNVSAAGVPESFIIRDDCTLQVGLRFHEDEWPDVQKWLNWCQKTSQTFDFYPNQAYAHRYLCYLEDPKPGSSYDLGRTSLPHVYELKVTLRSADRPFNVKLLGKV